MGRPGGGNCGGGAGRGRLEGVEEEEGCLQRLWIRVSGDLPTDIVSNHLRLFPSVGRRSFWPHEVPVRTVRATVPQGPVGSNCSVNIL